MSQVKLPASKEKDRIAGLDGVRGFFINAVIISHLQLWNAGWFAMPWFFVMSGYLITRILIADLEAVPRVGAFLTRFYARRIVRIAPIYYLYLLLIGLFCLAIGRFHDLYKNLIACFFFVSNYFFLTPAGDPNSTIGKLLLHTWSLAVEEQFYMVWPLLIALVPRKRLPIALCLIAAFSVVFRVAVIFGLPHLPNVPDNPLAPYAVLYLVTFNWLDAFAIGAAMNLTRWAPKPWQVWTLIAFTLAVGIYTSGAGTIIVNNVPRYLVMGYPFLMEAHKQAIWGYSLVAINAGVFFLAVVNGGHFLRFFSNSFLEWMGARTYSAYLFHIPAIAMLVPTRRILTDWLDSDVWSGLAVLPFVFCITWITAHFFFTFVEKPMLNYRNKLIPDWAVAVKKPKVLAADAGAAGQAGASTQHSPAT